jgi:hypothetical protein
MRPEADGPRTLWRVCQALALAAGPWSQPMAWEAAPAGVSPARWSPTRSPGATSRRQAAATRQTTPLAGLGWGLSLLPPEIQTGRAVGPLPAG